MRPVYPTVEIPNEEYLTIYFNQEQITKLESKGYTEVSRRPCDPDNAGIGTVQMRAAFPLDPVGVVKRRERQHLFDFAIFANTGRISAFNHKKVLWVFSKSEDKRFQGKLPGRLYVFADYFGKVLKTCWARHHSDLPGEYLEFMGAPVPTPTPAVVEMPLGSLDEL